MRRQLLDPVGELDTVNVVRRLCGVQAQVPAAAELAVRVRQETSLPDDVNSELEGRRLIRTWRCVARSISWRLTMLGPIYR